MTRSEIFPTDLECSRRGLRNIRSTSSRRSGQASLASACKIMRPGRYRPSCGSRHGSFASGFGRFGHGRSCSWAIDGWRSRGCGSRPILCVLPDTESCSRLSKCPSPDRRSFRISRAARAPFHVAPLRPRPRPNAHSNASAGLHRVDFRFRPEADRAPPPDRPSPPVDSIGRARTRELSKCGLQHSVRRNSRQL